MGIARNLQALHYCTYLEAFVHRDGPRFWDKTPRTQRSSFRFAPRVAAGEIERMH
jgi:hypothetical protein